MTYQHQLILTILLVLIGNIITTLCHSWIYRSIAFCIAGLIWMIHPVMFGREEPTPLNLRLVRISGVILILIGIFTRVHY